MIPNQTITSAVVTDGVVDLRTGEEDEKGNEKGVFQYCIKLETVRLPESLRKIGACAFLSCKALVHVNIPSGVNEIGHHAFSHSSLENVTIPEGVISLPQCTFWNCKSLKSVKLPSSLKKIGKAAFAGCNFLTKINFDALGGVTEIGPEAFAVCLSLTSFKLPPLLKTIDAGIFNECFGLAKVELPPCLEAIKPFAFKKCHHADLTIDLPETVKDIEGEALRGCRIRLPTSLPMLINGGDVEGLLHQVKEVVMSWRVNLGLLVDHLKSRPRRKNILDANERGLVDMHTLPFLDPKLKFRVLFKSVPESFFSFDVSPAAIKLLHKQQGDGALMTLVESAFAHKISLHAEILKCMDVELPAEITANIVPFIHGKGLTDEAIGNIVTTVKELMSDATMTARARKLVAEFRRGVTKSCCGYPGCDSKAPLRCSSCKRIWYCSKDHQKAHWKAHKKHCKLAGQS